MAGMVDYTQSSIRKFVCFFHALKATTDLEDHHSYIASG